MNSHKIRALASLCALSILAACGGNGAPGAPIPQASGASTIAGAKATVALFIKIPGRSANAVSRHANYVGSGTQSATLAITPLGASMPTSQQTVPCTTTCSATAALDPGTYTFAVSLFNGPNGTGKLLSSGSASKKIVAGTANTVNLSFTGSVARVNVTLDDPTGDGYLSVGAPSTATVTVEALDADGNTIIGNYDKLVTLTSSDGANAPLSVPAPAPTTTPAYDSSPPPTPANQPNAKSVTIVNSAQHPMLSWAGNATTLYDIVVTATIAGITTTDSVLLGIEGGGTPPPAINPSDPETTPIPYRTVAPKAHATVAPPATSGVRPNVDSSPTPAPMPTTGTAAPLSVLTTQGNTLYGFVGGTAKTISLGLGSQVNAEADQRAKPLQQMNFSMSVNASGLTTFARRAPRVLDLNTTRVRGHGAAYVDYHPQSPLASLRPLGRGIAKRGRFGFSGTPMVGSKSNWFVGTSTQPATARAMINDAKTNKPRFVLWSADSSMLPDSILPTFQQQVMNADQAITAAQGDFHYAANAPGIQTYATCDTNKVANGEGPGVVADPGYVSIIFYDGTQNTGIANALGFFGAGEFTSQPISNCNGSKTNEAPTIFIQYNPGTNLTGMQINELQGTITHEYSHLVSYVLKSINQAGSYDSGWLLEGLGTFVQDYTSPPAVAGMAGPLGAPTAPIFDTQESLRLLPTFFASPQSYTLTGFAGIEGGTYTAGGATNYGLSYLFVKYCVDRFGNNFIKDLGTSTARGTANITYAAQKNGGGMITFAQLYQDFVTMLAVSGMGVTTDARYNMQSFNIRGGAFPAQCAGCSGATLTGPATVSTLASGQTTIVQNMFPGGFAFFNMNAVDAGGNVVRVDDTNSGALQLYGALGQQ